MIRWFIRATIMLLGIVALAFIVTDGAFSLLMVMRIAGIVGASAWLLNQTLDDFAYVPGSIDYSAERRALEEEREEQQGRGEDTADTDAKLEKLAPSDRFDSERRLASLTSASAFLLGLVVVAAVLGYGLVDLNENQLLTTGDSLARIAVVTAAFYLAGQLFRRSTTLNLRAQEFRRAAIAMEILDRLAETLENPKERDSLRRAVYQHHLTGESSAPSDDEKDSDSVLSILEQLNKMKGQA